MCEASSEVMTRCASAAGDARFSRSGGARAISAESRSFGRVDLACTASQTPLSPPQHLHCESFPACRYRRSLLSTLCTESAHPAPRGTDRVDPTPGRAATASADHNGPRLLQDEPLHLHRPQLLRLRRHRLLLRESWVSSAGRRERHGPTSGPTFVMASRNFARRPRACISRRGKAHRE